MYAPHSNIHIKIAYKMPLYGIQSERKKGSEKQNVEKEVSFVSLSYFCSEVKMKPIQIVK